MSTTYTIFCVILGETTSFSVDIASNKTFDHLKDAIKEKRPIDLGGVDAAKLALYRVDISGSKEARIEELRKMADDFGQRDELDALVKLTKIYSTAPPEETIHIIVQTPQTGPRGLKRMMSFRPDDGVAGKRRHLLLDSTSNVAPSAFGGQETYKRLDPTKFALNRPPVSETVPLAISHPIFGEFVEEVDTYIPTATDNALVRDLRNVMSKTYDTELDYCSEFRRVLWSHYPEVQLQPAQIGSTKYVSDGHLSVGEFMSSVCEGKLWKGTGDPEVQAAGYLIASIRYSVKLSGDYPDKLPCMIICVFGSFICFAGAVLTDRLHLETLTPAFPMHTNQHEGKIATQAARTLGAFRSTIKKLQVHYARLAREKAAQLALKKAAQSALKKTAQSALEKKPFASEDYEGLVYPYMCHYSDKNNTRVNFRYVRRLYDNKLLFLCQATSDQVTPGPKLCVKFTRRYSEKAHQYCADLGVAPELYKVEELPGGWIMVVMQYLDDNIYERLLVPENSEALGREVGRVISVLHQGNFVHGDVREVNLMVCREWDTTGKGKNVLLVDFDWAGPKGTTCYPPNVNCEIYRPPGAIDGGLITQEHDRAMVVNMFN